MISAVISIFNSAENICLWIADVAIEIFLLIVAGYTVYLFRKRRPNAVFWGIVYLVIALLTNVFGLISGVSGSMLSVSAIIWEILWLSYMIFSDQVQRIIPKSFRKVTSVDWAVLVALLIVPVSSFVVGCSQINYSEKHHQIESEDEGVLAYNQRTDGRIVFTIPDGFECKSEDYDSDGTKIIFFSLVNDNEENCTIFSSYDSDKTYSNLDSYWNAWKADGITDSNIGDIDKGLIKVNGNDCLYRITKLYVGDGYLFWHFYLLFDDKTGIVVLLTCYDGVDSPNYIEEILESVQFAGA